MKHSSVGGGELGLVESADTMSCTHVGTTSWPSVAFTSATASTTACDRLSRLERPLASVIPGRVDPAGSRASDANARREKAARTPRRGRRRRRHAARASEATIEPRGASPRDGVQTPETRAPRGKAAHGAAGTRKCRGRRFTRAIGHQHSAPIRRLETEGLGPVLRGGDVHPEERVVVGVEHARLDLVRVAGHLTREGEGDGIGEKKSVVVGSRWFGEIRRATETFASGSRVLSRANGYDRARRGDAPPRTCSFPAPSRRRSRRAWPSRTRRPSWTTPSRSPAWSPRGPRAPAGTPGAAPHRRPPSPPCTAP